MTLGVLVSGDLGFEVMKDILNHFQVNFVLTDSLSLNIISVCNERGILVFTGNPRSGQLFAKHPALQCDVVVSVNYLFIIEDDLIKLPKKIAINFHGSLLPKYRGRTPHVWAIINSETETGITAHKIDHGCDTGEIISQKRISINPEDTGATILDIFKKIYPDFVFKVLKKIQNNSFSLVPQNNEVATYFGKRVPEDGRINWSWQKERIHNWIRAQAYPYPGAFTYCNNQKIIINKIKFSDLGFHYGIADGTVMGFNNTSPIVKTPNGCVELIDFKSNFKLEQNNLLK